MQTKSSPLLSVLLVLSISFNSILPTVISARSISNESSLDFWAENPIPNPLTSSLEATEIIQDFLNTYADEEVSENNAAQLEVYSSFNLIAPDYALVGQTHVDPAIGAKLFSFVRQGTPPKAEIIEILSQRELEVLRWLAQGLSNAEIAKNLYLAEGTVKNHVSSILSKFDLTDRAQAVALAWETGIAKMPPTAKD